MFKGLRTKIESEQKGQKNDNEQKLGQQKQQRREAQSEDIIYKPSKTGTISDSKPKIFSLSSNALDDKQTNIINDSHKFENSLQYPCQTTNHQSIGPVDIKQLDSDNQGDYNAKIEESHKTAEELKIYIDDLKNQLHNVIKERDDIKNQLAHSNQLIVSLEQNAERRRLSNPSLETRLQGPISNPDEQASDPADGVLTAKLYHTNGQVLNTKCDSNISDEVGLMRHEIIELQAQLAKKNRQLKIRQQNLIDIKKTLQKEILDHGRTQEELTKLQKRIEKEQVTPTNNGDSSSVNTQNGIFPDESGSVDQITTDKPDIGSRISSSQAVNATEDTLSLNATVQFDRISCLSQSSASVDDFESHDLQQSNNKEVSHEYLRNVLFRYMTSTDTETTQHLVKAISVLMDFSPDQAAAIKRAMNGRTTSWLRLK